MISAKVICDSISPTGSRLTTIEANFHRFILSEVNTHRAFSRNSASSRAIPTQKLIDQVRNNPAIPIEFGSNQPGMQAGRPLNLSQSRSAKLVWLRAADEAAMNAERLHAMGVHKQVTNRVLEPFMWHRAIITSTEAGWSNFFDQRISPLAQPEISELALKIRCAMTASDPTPLDYGQWHLPYGQSVDNDGQILSPLTARAISAARCARVSYLTHDGKRDVQKDLDLYQKLVTADPPHWSPLEHVATPGNQGGAGNFDGWHQLRHLPESQ